MNKYKNNLAQFKMILVLISKAEKLKNDLSEFYSKSKLPHSPDMKLINSLLLEIRDTYYKPEFDY